MSTHEVGRRFEALAARHLQDRGWRILDRNVRDGRKEVDLVARRDGIVAFVEVKGRRGSGFGHPLEAITWRKRKEIAQVARTWLREHRLPSSVIVRFDAVSVTLGTDGEPRLEHVEDAWRLG